MSTNPLMNYPASNKYRKQFIRCAMEKKTPGADSIPAKIHKQGGQGLTMKLLQLFQLIWEEEEAIPQDFKDASIIHLYNHKENRQICNNYRGISILSSASKILARLLLNFHRGL
uniref:Uncharacterized protein n=1 Tax=Scleropages formosus TaxID=113540 RepID=A0A8D0C5W6_SCLFO